jgi:hypothetical protein
VNHFLCLLLFLAFLAPATGATDDATYSSALEAYEKGQFDDAVAGFSSLAQKAKSPTLFYNLGNALWRQGKQGEAILWYRRALLLDPSFTEAKQNLAFARETTAFQEELPPSWKSLSDRSKKDHWIIAATACFWLTVFFWIWAVRHKQNPGRQSLAILATILFFLGTSVTGTLWFLKSRDHPTTRAVITSTGNATAYTAATATTGSPVLDLPPGSLVRSVEERGAWVYAELPGDLRGWIRKEQLTPLWPWEQEWIQ